MTVNQQKHQAHPTHHLPSITSIWLFLRSPGIFGAVVGLTFLAALLSIIIPQRPATVGDSPNNFIIWVSSLPPFFRQNIQFFETTGLFNIYQTVWFWLPAALLTLVCLIILADSIGPTRQRLKPATPEQLLVPHPLSRYRAQTIRLNAPQDAAQGTSAAAPLTEMKGALQANGYRISAATETQVIATRNPGRWSGPVWLATGLLLLLSGAMLQSVGGQSSGVMLSAKNSAPAMLAGQPVRLEAFLPQGDRAGNLTGGEVMLAFGKETPIQQMLYRPFYRQGWWILPARLQPQARVIFALKQDAEEIDLVFQSPNKPVQFKHTTQDLIFTLFYKVEDGKSDYRLTVVNSKPGAPILVAKNNTKFAIADLDLNGNIFVEDRVLVRAAKLPGLPFFLLGIAMLLTGLILMLLPKPALIRLDVVTKGRGSRINITTEGMRKAPDPDALFGGISIFQQDKQE